MLGLWVISAEVQIAFHVADHQHDFYEKGYLIVECHFVDIAQDVSHLRRQVGDQQGCR